jgi:hypothetical protein
MYPKLAPTSYTQSPEPEIAKKHFGFEFWLIVGLLLFLAGMLIAQWVFSALVKPLVTPGAIYSPGALEAPPCRDTACMRPGAIDP